MTSQQIADWVSAGATVLIMIVTSIYVYYSKKYVKFTKNLMEISEASLKLSREIFLVKEKPFLYITTIDKAPSALTYGDVTFLRLEFHIHNGGSGIGSLVSFESVLGINSMDKEYIEKKLLPKKLQNVTFTPHIVSLFIPSGQERVYDSLFLLEDYKLKDEKAEYSIDLTMRYKGIQNEKYSYSYSGKYNRYTSKFVWVQEDYSEF